MEQQPPATPTETGSEKMPLDGNKKCTTTMTNNCLETLTLESSQLVHGKWTTQPWQTISSPSSGETIFEAQGKSGTGYGTEGTVEYQFSGMYGGLIMLKVFFSVPFTGKNQFGASLSGNVSGQSGTYMVTYTFNENGDDPQPNIDLFMGTNG